jgi:hypothetical protein
MATSSNIFLIDDDFIRQPEVVHSRVTGTEGLGSLIKEAGTSKETHAVGIDTNIFEFDLEGYVEDFNESVIGAYNRGSDDELPADMGVARSIIPAGGFRVFYEIAFNSNNPAVPWT